MTSPEEFYKQVEQSNFPTKNHQEGAAFIPPIGQMPKMPAGDGRNIGVVSIPSQIGRIENPTDGLARNPTGGITREAIRNPVTFPKTLHQHQGNCAQSIGQICKIGPNVTVGNIEQKGNGSIRIGTER